MNGSHIWWAQRRLRYQWLQSLFIVIGLGLGVAVFITVATQLVNSMRESERLTESDPFFKQVLVIPRQQITEAVGAETPVARLVTDRPEQRASLTLADFLDVREDVPGVRYALLPGSMTGMAAMARDNESLADTHVLFQGVTPDQFHVDRARLLAGTFFTWDDFLAARPLLVVDESWVKGYFPELSSPAEAIGRTIMTTSPVTGSAGRRWTIAGVVADPEESGQNSRAGRLSALGLGARFRGQPVRGNAYAPETVLAEGREVDHAMWMFQPEPDVPPATLAARIQAYLDAKLGPGRVEAYSPSQRMAEARREARRNYASLLGLASLALFIGAVSVLNLNLAHVLQRQRFIGLLAAIGASRRQLIGQSLVEALFLGVSGGLLGALLAYPGLRLLFLVQTGNIPEAARAQMALQYQVDPWVLLAGVALGGLLSLLFGIIPAWLVSRISPAEVLRE
ncbi:MAG: ABC transporter permease [Limnochordales bacterium]|nr:ABC transporter permease [Limnochordales bacterium]